METKVQVIFYSTWGHIHRMAEAIVEGARQVDGATVELLQVPELTPPETLEAMGAKAARASFAHVPMATVDRMAEADALIFGTPTRFGNMAAQMRSFLDQTGALWARGALTGKVGSVFASTSTQHGGQETTITSFHSTLLHHGLIIVGLPYSLAPGQNEGAVITGGSPYGATTISTPAGTRFPSDAELEMARIQGRHTTQIAKKLKNGGK